MVKAQSIQKTTTGSKTLDKMNYNNNGSYESNKAGNQIDQEERR